MIKIYQRYLQIMEQQIIQLKIKNIKMKNKKHKNKNNNIEPVVKIVNDGGCDKHLHISGAYERSQSSAERAKKHLEDAQELIMKIKFEINELTKGNKMLK
eukprot:260756_1